MGSLALTWADRDSGLAMVQQMKAAGTPFFLNFVLRFGCEKPGWYRDAGVPAITLSWGIDEELIAALNSAGIRVGVQVGSAGGAKRAMAAGADFIIAQGMEAGGHVQSTTPLDQLLREVLSFSGKVPVVAAGGIASAEDIARLLSMGAQAVMMGTRFVASHEALAHEQYKQALVAAKASDTAFTNCFDIDWPYAMHRVLRNATLDAWEAAGSPAAPDRPGEGDVIAHHGDAGVIRYSDTPPFAHASGDVLATCLYAGTGVGNISSVLPAAEIVRSLWAETQKLQRRST